MLMRNIYFKKKIKMWNACISSKIKMCNGPTLQMFVEIVYCESLTRLQFVRICCPVGIKGLYVHIQVYAHTLVSFQSAV